MRHIFLTALLLAGGGRVQADPLPPKDIMVQMQGRWAYSDAYADEQDSDFRCGKSELIISVEEEGGHSRYTSRLSGSVHIDRSDIRMLRFEDGRFYPGILLKYDGEERLDEAGNLVEWLLIMPDENTFVWRRRDWPEGHYTAPRVRCPVSDLIG